ncbi:TPA: hypothetical protein DEP58_02930 [Patescibacteria group bacterium]|nr:MAG: hypothetical protein UU98_C0007G0036 [Parcubacteria group bacterium GW2011_GWD2_42_14]HCC05236.1 hypothetical protein [Patescibacteria group bacterium]
MDNPQEEKKLSLAAVCLLYKEGKILLAWKTDKIGKDTWNGYGGGVEQGETIEECALRELEEETDGVIALQRNLEKIAIVHFHNTMTTGETFVCVVHFFLVDKWLGEVHETKEMIHPRWFPIDALPFHEMMPSDKDWLPIALGGSKIIVHAHLGPFQKELLRPTEIEYVTEF